MAPSPGTRTLARQILATPGGRAAAGGPSLVRDDGTAVALRDGLVVGRARGAGVRLRDRDVSRVHAAVVGAEGGFALVDRSRNGLRVNGRRVRGRAPLRAGDVVQVGRARLRVEPAGARSRRSDRARLRAPRWLPAALALAAAMVAGAVALGL